MKKIFITGLLMVATSLAIAAPLKEGVFRCRDSQNYLGVLHVKQHPAKAEKIVVNWQGQDRILHFVPTTTGAVRYEGAVSKLLYIQIPAGSYLLDEGKMQPILTDCIYQKR